jgi:TusA-related sulfurtransferase
MSIQVDVRGLPCPRPVISTKKALEEIDEGTIAVLLDNPESKENVRRFARSQGCEVMGLSTQTC